MGEIILDYPGKPDVITVFREGGKRRLDHRQGKGEVMREAETGIICFEDGEGGHKPRNTGSH